MSLELSEWGRRGRPVTDPNVRTYGLEIVDAENKRVENLVSLTEDADPSAPWLAPYVGRGALTTLDAHEMQIDAERTQMLMPVRRRFRSLTALQRKVLNMTLQTKDVPTMLKPAEDNTDWADHLASAPDELLMNYLQWNQYDNDQKNSDPETVEKIDGYRDFYYERVAVAVHQSRLPKSAIRRADKIDEVPVAIGDVHTTSLGGMSGFHMEGGGVVLGRTMRQHTFNHEMGHALMPKFPYPSLNEGYVEQLTVGLESGKMTDFDPNEANNQGSYGYKRMGLKVICESGVEPIDRQLVIDAPFDTRGKAAQELVRQSRVAYPDENVWAFREEQYDSIAGVLQQRYYDLPWQLVQESTDSYANTMTSYLGVQKQGASMDEIVSRAETWSEQADDMYHQALTAAREDPSVDPRGEQARRKSMHAFVARRVRTEVCDLGRDRFGQ